MTTEYDILAPIRRLPIEIKRDLQTLIVDRTGETDDAFIRTEQFIGHVHPNVKYQLELSGMSNPSEPYSSGYNQRSRIETQIGRWKAVIGPKLKARCFENQKTETQISVAILNKMTEFGRPVFEQIA